MGMVLMTVLVLMMVMVLGRSNYRMKFSGSYNQMFQELDIEVLNYHYVSNILLVLMVIYIFDLFRQVLLL